MRNTSWAVYITALLLGSSLAIVSDASVSDDPLALDSPGCTALLMCSMCVEDGCQLEPLEFVVYQYTTQEERCVEYDWINPHHCAILDVRFYNILDWTLELVGTCKRIDCASGAPQAEECDNPWWGPPPIPPLRPSPETQL